MPEPEVPVWFRVTGELPEHTVRLGYRVLRTSECRAVWCTLEDPETSHDVFPDDAVTHWMDLKKPEAP